jgi:ADP-heptose:LPS heptosyltransferase
LIIRLGAVGDGLLLAPALACLRRAHPSAYIEVAGVLWRLRLLVGPTLANAAKSIEDYFRNGEARAAELRRFDRIVLFAIDLRADLVQEIVRAVPERVEVHHSFPMNGTNDHHVIDHIQRALGVFGVEPNGDRHYQLPIPDSAREFAQQFLARTSSQGRRVYIHAGTKIATKRWPATRFAEVGRRLVERGCDVYLGCGPLDEETVRPLEEGLSGLGFVSAKGQDIVQTAGVLARMDLYIGIDCGITHLAALVGAPTIAIYGATRPQLWGPIGPRVHVLVGSRNLDCCMQDHPRVCEGGCMEEVSVATVLAAAEDVIGRDGR